MAQDPSHWKLPPTARSRGGVTCSATVRPATDFDLARDAHQVACECEIDSEVLHPLAGISCATPIDLAEYSSPISNMASPLKTDFLSSCGSGFDAVYYFSLPAGYTIGFNAPSSTYYHTNHEIRYDGSCPGSTQSNCVSASSYLGLENTRSTSADVYYIQSGFTSADSALNVRWTGRWRTRERSLAPAGAG
jgi:hypothetical protein